MKKLYYILLSVITLNTAGLLSSVRDPQYKKGEQVAWKLARIKARDKMWRVTPFISREAELSPEERRAYSDYLNQGGTPADQLISDLHRGIKEAAAIIPELK